MIKAVYVMPHPPLMVPGIGNADQISATIRAARMIADEIAEIKPDTIAVISPHAVVFQDFIHISDVQWLKGSFSSFGRRDIEFTFENNREMVREIVKEADKEGLPVGSLSPDQLDLYRLDNKLDHGCMVPLYFIREKNPDFKLLCIPVAGFTYEDLYKAGTLLQKAADHLGTKTVVIASADLSHKLKIDGPYGYAKEGPLFDEKVKEFVEKNDVSGLMNMDERLIKKAAMCGLPSIVMAYGSLGGNELVSKVLSYEGPYGVGYMTARILPKRSENNES